MSLEINTNEFFDEICFFIIPDNIDYLKTYLYYECGYDWKDMKEITLELIKKRYEYLGFNVDIKTIKYILGFDSDNIDWVGFKEHLKNNLRNRTTLV